MPSRYTAKKMREMAEILENKFPDILPAAMLRQAADDMEREEDSEKKYEYAAKWDDGKIDGISPYKDEVSDSISFVEYISSISADDKTGCKLVRREVGDCLWMLAEICSVYGWRMSDVMAENIAKLEDRANRGVICGEGDNR